MLTISGTEAGSKFGWALSTGYTNSDGYKDLIMGTDGYSIDTFQTGKMYLFRGALPMNATADDEYTMDNMSDDFLGFSIGSGVDINDDGFDEVIIGMPGHDYMADDAGGATLVSGGSLLSMEATFYGSVAGEELGKSVGFWEDFGLENKKLIVLGTSSYDNYLGRIYLYFYQFLGLSDCGDVNADGSFNLLDVTFLISYLYKQGTAPEPLEKCDVNSSGSINLLDITHIIAFLYKGGADPVCPH